jgi:ADP-ribose pyrophosphatase YjhB (NUDIX family)
MLSTAEPAAVARHPVNLVAQQRKIGAAAKPRIGCAGIVRAGDSILLGQRNKDPNRGLWVLPGGGVQFGETLADTLAREIAEEAAIEIVVEDVFNVCEIVNPPEEHRIIVYLNARHHRGNPTASSDLSDVRFFAPEELRAMSRDGLISPVVETILRKAGLI